MMKSGTSGRRNLALGLLAALVVVLALSRWTGTGEPPVTPPAPAVPSPRATAARRDLLAEATHRPQPPSEQGGREAYSASPAPLPTEGPLQARPTEGLLQARPTPSGFEPTPSGFDHATSPRSDEAKKGPSDEERFPTTGWYTHEDPYHPELYFQLAEQMPELNRPEERRDTLAHFLATQEQLRSDLGGMGENEDGRQETVDAIMRYDNAIARLKALIDAEEATP